MAELDRAGMRREAAAEMAKFLPHTRRGRAAMHLATARRRLMWRLSGARRRARKARRSGG